jgi:TPR repeat protein
MPNSLPTTTTLHCSVCANPSSLRCSRCLGAQYCDVTCQRKDWKSHKEACKRAEGVKKSIELDYGPQTTVEDVDAQIVLYRRMAELGHGVSMFNLGVAYDTGMGVVQDQVEAIKLFRRSAELDVLEAQYNLGVAYAKGEGVNQDNAEAVKWYRKAAESEHVKSQFKLGQALFFGYGVEKDYAESLNGT